MLVAPGRESAPSGSTTGWTFRKIFWATSHWGNTKRRRKGVAGDAGPQCREIEHSYRKLRRHLGGRELRRPLLPETSSERAFEGDSGGGGEWPEREGRGLVSGGKTR